MYSVKFEGRVTGPSPQTAIARDLRHAHGPTAVIELPTRKPPAPSLRSRRNGPLKRSGRG